MCDSKNGLTFYFAGSIRGGREKAEDYKKIIEALQKYGTVLTEHVGNISLSNQGEQSMSDNEIYQRDVSWIDESDIVIADVTVASLGVGYELAYAEAKNKEIICLYQTSGTGRLSAMIAGNNNFRIILYTTIPELIEKLEKCLQLK